jgi:hypothetical protein
VSRKKSLFNKTLNTRYFGRKTSFYDDSVSLPKRGVTKAVYDEQGVKVPQKTSQAGMSGRYA